MKPTNTLQYKNYLCQVSYSNLKDCLIGRIVGMKQIPTFSAQTVAGIKESFHGAVEDYLTACTKAGKEPTKPYTGMYTLRFPPAVQEALTVYALANSTTLAHIMQKALDEYIENHKIQMPKKNGEEN